MLHVDNHRQQQQQKQSQLNTLAAILSGGTVAATAAHQMVIADHHSPSPSSGATSATNTSSSSSPPLLLNSAALAAAAAAAAAAEKTKHNRHATAPVVPQTASWLAYMTAGGDGKVPLPNGSSANHKRVYYCQRCLNHGRLEPRKNHKCECAFASCSCAKCILVEKRRVLNTQLHELELEELSSSGNGNMETDDNPPSEQQAVPPEEEAAIVERDPTLPRIKGERVPNCQKCGQHGRKSRLKGHKRVCPFRDCNCPKCQVVSERQKLMADQIKIRRRQRKETLVNMTRENIAATLNIAAAVAAASSGHLPPFQLVNPATLEITKLGGPDVGAKNREESAEAAAKTASNCLSLLLGGAAASSASRPHSPVSPAASSIASKDEELLQLEQKIDVKLMAAAPTTPPVLPSPPAPPITIPTRVSVSPPVTCSSSSGQQHQQQQPINLASPNTSQAAAALAGLAGLAAAAAAASIPPPPTSSSSSSSASSSSSSANHLPAPVPLNPLDCLGTALQNHHEHQQQQQQQSINSLGISFSAPQAPQLNEQLVQQLLANYKAFEQKLLEEAAALGCCLFGNNLIGAGAAAAATAAQPQGGRLSPDSPFSAPDSTAATTSSVVGGTTHAGSDQSPTSSSANAIIDVCSV